MKRGTRDKDKLARMKAAFNGGYNPARRSETFTAADHAAVMRYYEVPDSRRAAAFAKLTEPQMRLAKIVYINGYSIPAYE